MKQTYLNLNAEKTHYTSEAFKSIRANVQFCGPDVRAIVITSCLPDDGKSTTSLGIALALAAAGKKTLLVDSDLRKSDMVRKYSDVTDVVGFSELISGQAGLEDVLYKTQDENLDVIFSGQYPANPAELLSSSALKIFIEERKTEYDYIIVDTPPLGIVVDAAVIASVCDSAILVVPEGKVKTEMALGVKSQLEKSGAHIIGVVFNNTKKKGMLDIKGGYSKKYYGKYVNDYRAK